VRKALYILSDLEDDDIIWMARQGEVRRVAAGETLIEAGVPVSHLYFVIDGTLEVTTRSGERLAALGLGEVVGEMSFVEKRLPDTNVRALGPAALLAIPRDAMLAAFASDNGLAMRFYRALAVFLSDRLRSMSAHDDGELDEGLLDNVQQAGERFIRLVSMSASSGAVM
jgi:CRP-like cAMP-binding protein